MNTAGPEISDASPDGNIAVSEEPKFISLKGTTDVPEQSPSPSCGESQQPKLTFLQPAATTACCPAPKNEKAAWMISELETSVGTIPVITGALTSRDFWEHVKCRISAFRTRFTVQPGLYAIGAPGPDSDVFVTANYKYSFDMLRQAVREMSAWILVLDTHGINVWCAAGKGTFGTEELIRRISVSGLAKVVSHRRVVLPQLGAVGVSAPLVAKRSGFRVLYGPVAASDIPAYVAAGYKASHDIRTIRFGFTDRLVLTPMEIIPAMKHFPLFALIILLLFGLRAEGVIFADALSGGMPFLLLGLVSVAAGAFLTPLLLPYIPFRAFSVKGLIVGAIATAVLINSLGMAGHSTVLVPAAAAIFFPMASSYIALQFTGSTTFTHMSGVKRELKIMIPLYLGATALSALLLIVFRILHWRMA